MTDLNKKCLLAGIVLALGTSTGVQGQSQPGMRSGLGGILGNRGSQPATSAKPASAPPARSVDPAVKATSTANSGSARGQMPTARTDSSAIRTNGVLPTLTPVDQLDGVQLNLPTEPIEPYLLTKEAGPFMVMAHTFRGPDAVRWAQALAMELRSQNQLMAYVYFKKIKPMNSNVRGVPPTAAPEDGEGRISEPEIYRIYDEAVVLVGDAQTMKDAEALLAVVKKIKPAFLSNVPSIFPWRTGAGLKKAIVTANPLVPAEALFAREEDPLVERMNHGPYSLYNCPGPYTLVVARFVGRSTFGDPDKEFLKDDNLKTSPLVKASDDAELLAAELNKDVQLKQAGYQAFVYHDRNRSVVTLGQFNTKIEQEKLARDPKIQSIRQHLDKLNQNYLGTGKVTTAMAPTDMMEVPKPAVKQKISTGLFK